MLIDMLSDLQDMAAATSWMADGICGQTDPEEFFPDQGESCEAAKRVCQGCPVEARCLAYALENEIPYGVWGGATAAERHEPGAASSTTTEEDIVSKTEFAVYKTNHDASYAMAYTCNCGKPVIGYGDDEYGLFAGICGAGHQSTMMAS